VTTYTALVADLVAMTITGQTSLAAPPASITGKTPVRWPMPPSGDSTLAAMGGTDYDRVMRVTLNVAVEAVGQSTASAEFTDTVTALDNLESALQTLNQTAAYGLSWTITMGIVTVGDINYYGLTCAVTAVDYS